MSASIPCCAISKLRGIPHDCVRILHDFQMLIAVLPPKPHALTYDLQNVENTKRPVPFVGTQFAVIGVADCYKCIHVSGTCGFQLFQLKFLFKPGSVASGAVLQSDGRHVELNNFNFGAQQIFRGFNDASDPWMFMYRNSHRYGLAQIGTQLFKLSRKKRMNGVISNGSRRLPA